MPFVEDAVAFGAGDDEPIVAVGLISDGLAGIEILQDEFLRSGEVEIERIVVSKDREFRAIGALEAAAVITVRRRLSLEKIRIVDRRAVAVVPIGAPMRRAGRLRRSRRGCGETKDGRCEPDDTRRHPVGGAISSRLFCRASGPSCVTDTAAMKSSVARQANTVVRPQPFCTHRIVGRINAVASRPTPEAQPKPDARALVGNTSEVKICIELPSTWTKKTMMKPAIRSSVAVPALANTIAIKPAATNAQIAVILRPNLSSAYIMKMLAVATAKFMTRVYCSDLVMLKPLAFMMFGSQAPSPMAMPKNAVKQIMPAMTRRGNKRKTTLNGSLLVVAASSVDSGSVGPAMPRRSRTFSASSPRPWVARKRGDSGSVKRNTQTIRASAPMPIHTPRHTYSGVATMVETPSTSPVPIGHTQAPPMKWTIARMRPRIALGEYSPA